jgi:V/A-type H+-transporting ATPase subunit E
MEEIKGTEALEREILNDAAKKAGKILRKASEEAERLGRISADTLELKSREMESLRLAKMAQLEKETFSKLPLEKARLKSRFIDDALRASVRKFLDSLDWTARGAWCLQELRKGSRTWVGRSLEMRYRNIDASSLRDIATLFGSRMVSPPVDDQSMPRPGIMVRSLDDAMIMTLTDGQLEERLLDEYRGELASALFPAAAGENESR